MISVAEVDTRLTAEQLVLPAEPCPLTAAHGRVLREPIQSDRDLPPHDRVTMDGIALRAAALSGGGAQLRLEGEALAGDAQKQLTDASAGALQVMTGAVLPAGSDSVIRIEDLELDRDRQTVSVNNGVDVTVGQNVHRQGSDCRAGAIVLQAGRRIGAPDIAVLASVGRAEVQVGRLPRVAVISTGDELIDIGQPIASHQVRRSNVYTVAAALRELGYPVTADHLPDDPQALRDGVGNALEQHDVLITTGAVSKGSADYLPDVLAALGVSSFLHGVSQRPGKPLWAGGTGNGNGNDKRVFALPGNPVSVMVCLRRYVVPFLERAQGAAAPPQLSAQLAAPVRFDRPLTLFLPVQLRTADGVLQADPSPALNSGDFLALVGTDGFVELDAVAQDDFAAGVVAPVHPWRPVDWGSGGPSAGDTR